MQNTNNIQQSLIKNQNQIQQDLNTGDSIAQLPVDSSIPTNNELRIVNTLFKNHKNEMNSIFEESKESLLVSILFIIFSLPQINNIIYKIVPPSKNSIYILLITKALLLGTIFWLIKHFYLSRN